MSMSKSLYQLQYQHDNINNHNDHNSNHNDIEFDNMNHSEYSY